MVLSYIDIHDEQIPDDVVLHGSKQKDGNLSAVFTEWKIIRKRTDYSG